MKAVLIIGFCIIGVIFYHVVRQANKPSKDLILEQFDPITNEHKPTRMRILSELACPENYTHIRTFWRHTSTGIEIQTEFLYNEGTGQKTGYVYSLYSKNGVCQTFKII